MTIQEMLPCNIEAEEKLLGTLLASSRQMVRIADALVPEDFYRDAHRHIFSTMLELYQASEGIDTITVAEALERKKIHIQDEIGGYHYLGKLMSNAFQDFSGSDNMEDHARLIGESALSRRGLEACQDSAYDFKHERPENALAKAEARFLELGQTTIKSDFTPLSALMQSCTDHVSEMQDRGGVIPGICTGFHKLDEMLGGLRDEKLIILAGRPGLGKTSWALTVAHHAAQKEHKKVGILSLEMSKEELVERLVAIDGWLDAKRVSSGKLEPDEWKRFIDSAARLTDMPIFIDDAFGATLVELKSKARRLQATHGLDILIVDYLQLMQSGSDENENEVKELSLISRGLKGLARELQIPVVALAQLNRAVESRQSKIPQLSDLRGSGTIEQDADVVLFLYREDEYNQQSERKGQCDVIVAKQRNGPKGTDVIGWIPSQTRFYSADFTSEEQEEGA